jgi:AhpD family alkylhydroperoxidase
MASRINYNVVLPDVLHGLQELNATGRRCSFDPKLLELVRIRVSQLNGCADCIRSHSRDARLLGETEDRLAVLSAWRNANGFSRREEAALGWCEALTLLPEPEGFQQSYQGAVEQFDDREIVALTAVVIATNGWNRMRMTFDVPHGTQTVRRGHGQTSDPEAERLSRRLETLETEIGNVRQHLLELQEGPPGPRYYESGTIHPELDDQSITPPG